MPSSESKISVMHKFWTRFARHRPKDGIASLEARAGDGLPLALDTKAESANPRLPAFLAPPSGAPAYHGFPLIDDVSVAGFTLGLISDSFSSESIWGDAYVVAPDGRRAGLVWSTDGERYFETLKKADGGRFGVFGVGTQHGPTSLAEASLFLEEILPLLQEDWERTARPARR